MAGLRQEIALDAINTSLNSIKSTLERMLEELVKLNFEPYYVEYDPRGGSLDAQVRTDDIR